MDFLVRYQTTGGSLTTRLLEPAPTHVEYPDGAAMTVQTTQDGATVVQRPLRDGRPRKWVWRNWPKGDPEYEALWEVLASLEYRTRLEAGLPGEVALFEDVSGVGGLDRRESGSRIFTPVRVLRASRIPRRSGGPVTYEESLLEFVITDPSAQI